MEQNLQAKKTSRLDKFLNFVEVAGNKLPHPVAMFFGFFVITIIFSFILSKMGVSVTYSEISKTTGEVVRKTTTVQNLLTSSGIRGIFTSAVKNFTGHAALGSIVVAMLGVGLADGTGLLSSLIKKLVLSTPKVLVSAIVVFAGVSGGFSANLLIGTTDPLLGGISTSAAQIVLPGYSVDATANYFFMFASTFLITIIGAWLTDKVVEPRLGEYTGPKLEVDANSELTAQERKGLRVSLLSIIIFVVVILFMVLPENAIFKLTEKEIAEFVKANHRQPGTMELLKPFFGQSIVFVLMLAFFIPGLCYGVTAGTVKSHKDVIKALVKAMSSCGQVFVIIFISAQFVYVFTKSNIGIVIAVNLANILKDMGVTGVAAAVGLIFLTAFVNLFIGGASSKWLMLSPVFIPMFVELGLTPEYTQLAYRIGDSTTNIISPLMSYFPIIVGFAAKYSKNEEDMGMGTIIAMMLPYSMAFLFAWTGLFLIWTFLGLPIGPGVKMFM